MQRVFSTHAVTILLASCLGSVVLAQDDSGYAAALARYKECISRKPFSHHVEGREKIAETREAAALELLSNDYAKSKSYPAYSRYTIAEMIARNFKTEEFMASVAQLRAKNDDLVDTWFWVRTLTNEIDQNGDAEALTLARESKKAHLRAAAIAALGASKDGDLKSAILANCLDFPRKEADRMLVLGAMTGALYQKKRRVNDDGYREALKAYISLLGKDVKLSHTAKVQMARHLSTQSHVLIKNEGGNSAPAEGQADEEGGSPGPC